MSLDNDALGRVAYQTFHADPPPAVAWDGLAPSVRQRWVAVALAVWHQVDQHVREAVSEERDTANTAVARLEGEIAAARADAKAAHERTRIVNECHLAAFRALGGR